MAGWKQWAIGEIVEAGDIQGFIQNQTVMVFDTDTARDTALSGVVIEGMMAYTKDSDLVKVYDGAAWIALAEAPDLTGLIPKSTVTTAGDLIVADGASSVTRIGVGTDDQVLTLVSGAPAWADAGGGGGQELITSVSLSGSSTSITSITQAYTHLRLDIVNATQGSGGDSLVISAKSGATVLDGLTSGKRISSNYYVVDLTFDSGGTTTGSSITASIDNYSSSDYSKPFFGYGIQTPNDTMILGGAFYGVSSGLTELIISAKSGYSFTGGTAYLYGVN